MEDAVGKRNRGAPLGQFRENWCNHRPGPSSWDLRYFGVRWHDGTNDYVAEDQLEEVSLIQSKDPYELIEGGCYGRSEVLRRSLTHVHLSGKLANLVYSMGVTNTDFYPHQHNPLLTIESGQDYERHCARLLEEGGWKVTFTPTSGDQGVDLIAVKDSVTLALQCKWYSSPVGNAAVQEVLAGAAFIKAHAAAVVTNATYTPAARTLAAATDVHLLHDAGLKHLRVDQVM